MKKDTIMKDIIKTITQDIATYLLHLNISKNKNDIKFIDKELSRIEKREADIIVDCKINGLDAILHLEIQSSYDSTMPRRMLRYFNEIKMLKEAKGKKVYQYMIYTGDKNVKMKDFIKDESLSFKYNVINMKN